MVFNQTSEQVTLQQSVALANAGQFTELARIAPQKGRMVFFEGKHYHASMHPTKSTHRIVVTFNFR